MIPAARSATARITVLIAEDHSIVREGFRRILELQGDFQVIGEAQNGRQAVELASSLQPGVILMDIAMPMLNGLEATRQILRSDPSRRILILSAHSDDAYVRNASESGAAGFLLKQTSASDVCRAIREVHQGRTYFSPSISRRQERIDPRIGRRTGSAAGRAVTLTSREMETLQLIAEGRSNKEIASDFGIGIKTVEKHREHLMRKLDLHDTAGITRYAISEGIIENSVQVTIV